MEIELQVELEMEIQLKIEYYIGNLGIMDLVPFFSDEYLYNAF